ncbi:hypothetical protein GCM10023091_00260 [Ravibacter arvi]|uniref:Uncharacterized protein n=1 Tax=Ravibacter arvi TaxID=2051041 RepID=A0ABP8LJ39_9BACT
MRYSSVLLFFFLYGCNKVNVPNDTAAQLSGRYNVKTYVVNGDTLLGDGIDKFGYSAFYIEVGRKSADSLIVTIQTKREEAPAGATFFRTAGFKSREDTYVLSYPNWEMQDYESEISGQIFQEKTTLPMSYLVLPPNYIPKSPANPNLNGVVIVAGKQSN